MEQLSCVLIGMVFGNILTAEFVVRAAIGKRPEEIGSGNPGMANVMTELGVKCGLLVLAGDLLKTIAACVLCYMVFGGSLGRISMLYAGIGAIVGHNYPVWNHFKGGKGVAVTCMFMVLFSPLWGIISVIAGGIVVLVSGYLAIGGITIAALYAVLMGVFGSVQAAVLAIVSLLLMVAKHGKIAVEEGTGRGKQVLLFRKMRTKV